jgi:hypothetical protein
MKNIAKAILAVMKEVKGIEKSMTVGGGAMSYKGVPDIEVKKVIGAAMEKNGLCILPISVEPKVQIDRWEEVYNNQSKQKQSIFTDVKTKYLLLHDSGESIELAGYGHGVDSQDKGAGKATTYALKYTLLYTFLIPTGKIDDADVHHSESVELPKATQPIKIETALNEINSCKTLEEMKEIWGKYKSLQPVADFLAAKDFKKQQLLAIQESNESANK